MRRRWLLWCCLGCCWLLHSLQYAEAHQVCWHACLGVLSLLESVRALVSSSLPHPHAAVCSCCGRCEPATKDRPESFNLFNTLMATCTVRVLLLVARACASLHACARRYVRSQPTDSYMPRRRSMWWTLKAVHIDLWALIHDHSALHIDQWSQASDCHGLREAPRAALGLWCGSGSMCHRRFRMGVNINDHAVNNDPATPNNACIHCI